MASAKDKCFEAAVDAYQKWGEEHGLPFEVKVTHQTPWVRDPTDVVDSQWRPVKDVSFKMFYHLYGYAMRKFGFSKTQARYPDMTIEMKDGSHLVVDNKFTRKDGTLDDWGTKPNKITGTNQEQDYKDINQQQGHDIGAPSLDKEKCKCDERDRKRQSQPKKDPVPNSTPWRYFVPSPPPTTPPGVPRPGRIRPGRIPIFLP